MCSEDLGKRKKKKKKIRKHRKNQLIKYSTYNLTNKERNARTNTNTKESIQLLIIEVGVLSHRINNLKDSSWIPLTVFR